MPALCTLRGAARGITPRPGHPQGSLAAGDPRDTRCTPQCWGQRGGASRPAKQQYVPSAKVDVLGPPAVTSSGDPPQPPLTSPLQMHLQACTRVTVLTPLQRAALSLLPGNDARPVPGPWAHGSSTMGTAAACGPSSGGVGRWGHQRPAPTGPSKRLSPQGDVMYRAQPCLQSSPQSSARGKVWALQTRAGAASPPHAGACRARGQPQAAREGAANPPCAVGMGSPQVSWFPSTHTGVQHPQQHPPAQGGAGGPAAAPQQAKTRASRVHPPRAPWRTQLAPVPPQTHAAFRVFSAAGSRPIPWPQSCTSHIPIAEPREVAMSLMCNREGARAAARGSPTLSPQGFPRSAPVGRGAWQPLGTGSEDNTRGGTTCPRLEG